MERSSYKDIRASKVDQVIGPSCQQKIRRYLWEVLKLNLKGPILASPQHPKLKLFTDS